MKITFAESAKADIAAFIVDEGDKLPEAAADRIVDLVFHLEQVKSIREVTKLLQIRSGTTKAARRAAAPKKDARKAVKKTKKAAKKPVRRAPAKRK